MTTYSGRFEYLGEQPGSEREGPCRLSFDSETLTLLPSGAPMACDLGDIDLFEAGDHELRLGLYSGRTIRLRQFGKAFSDLHRELLEAYRARLVRCLLVGDLDEVARFTGRVQLESAVRTCAGPAEIRLYPHHLAVVPDAAAGFQWRLADVGEVRFDERDYTVALMRGRERLIVHHLARRTGEFIERVRQGVADVDERTARVVRAVFPFLTPDQIQVAGAEMREGRPASLARLGSLHRLSSRVLLDRVVDASLRPYLEALLARRAGADGFVGFTTARREDGQAPLTSEDDASEAAADEQDAEGQTRASNDGEPGGGEGATVVGDERTDVVFWFLVPLAAPGASGVSHLAWETTSRAGRATYLFRVAQPDGGAVDREAVSALVEGLAAVGFRREVVYLAQDTLESDPRYRHYAIALRKVPELTRVRGRFAGRALHAGLPRWTRQLDTVLSG